MAFSLPNLDKWTALARAWPLLELADLLALGVLQPNHSSYWSITPLSRHRVPIATVVFRRAIDQMERVDDAGCRRRVL